MWRWCQKIEMGVGSKCLGKGLFHFCLGGHNCSQVEYTLPAVQYIIPPILWLKVISFKAPKLSQSKSLISEVVIPRLVVNLSPTP